MIGYLKGKCKSFHEQELTLDVNGVGYELTCSQFTLENLKEGQNLELSVYTHVREDIIQLFGFTNELEKKIFKSLLKVNGVGPKMAINILSGSKVKDLIDLIETENVGALTKLPKVGKKTAEQIILALRGKLIATDKPNKTTLLGARKDIYSALINLGYKSNEVDEVITFIPADTELGEGVKKGLKLLSGV